MQADQLSDSLVEQGFLFIGNVFQKSVDSGSEIARLISIHRYCKSGLCMNLLKVTIPFLLEPTGDQC